MSQDSAQIQRQLAALKTVQNIAQELSSELDIKRLLHKILKSVVGVLNATEGSLLLWDPNTDELVFVVTESTELLNYRIPSTQGIAGWVFTHCQPLIVGDVSQDRRFNPEVDQAIDFHTQSMITVPLINPTEKIGVIQVLNKKSGEQFDDQDLDTLTALAVQATTAVINARLYQELEAEKNRIIAAESQARKKLARDLHDGPAQILAVMIMDVDFIIKLQQREPAKVADELLKLKETAQKTLAQVRNTMFELRPLVLETEGLKEALEIYAERLISTEGMNIHLDVRNLEERLPSKIENLCFAIVQEAVVNVKKHAKAKDTWIVAERRKKDLILAVRDNGVGFNVDNTKQRYDRRGSLGLLNMKERAELLGAQYSINSVPGRGTLVSLIVPLYDQDDLAEGMDEKSRPDSQAVTNGRRRGTGPLIWPGESNNSSEQGRKKGTGPLLDGHQE